MELPGKGRASPLRSEFHLLQLDGQQGQTLADIIMKVPGDSRAFFLLRPRKTVAQRLKFFLRAAAFGDVLVDGKRSHKCFSGENADTVQFHVDQRAIFSASLRGRVDDSATMDSERHTARPFPVVRRD